MGRVARYKREKTVFDVDRLHERKSDRTDDPLGGSERKKNKKRARSGGNAADDGDNGDNVKDGKRRNNVDVSSTEWESNSKRLQLSRMIKLGPDGELLAKSSNSSSSSSSSRSTEKDKKAKKDKSNEDNRFKLQRKRVDETFREFNARVERETQQHLMESRKKTTRKALRAKANRETKKEKLKEKKLRKIQNGLIGKKGHDGDWDDFDEMERRVYARNVDTPCGIHDVADAPPEFNLSHNIKSRNGSNPLDRSRFAQLGFVSSVAKSGNSSKSSLSSSSEYERIQMEAMRARVVGKYDDLRRKRREAGLANLK